MKVVASIAAAVAILAATPASAAPISASFQNLGTAVMTVSNINSCGTFTPTLTTVGIGTTTGYSSTDCGTATAAQITYAMGAKTCAFRLQTIYTPPNSIAGTAGYYTPASSTTAGGGAICKVVSADTSGIFTTGAYKVVFSMK